MTVLRVMLSGAFVALLFACAAPEKLEPMSAGVPAGIDLSGNWELRDDSASERRRIDEALSKAAGPGIPLGNGPPRRQRRGSTGDLVYVFLETGRSLKVTQTSEGMFLSFNRSRVEEFRFGENRMINVGAISAQRVSGWVGSEYVVKSLDKNGLKLTEKLWLSNDGNSLNREFTFSSKNEGDVVARQTYDRAEN